MLGIYDKKRKFRYFFIKMKKKSVIVECHNNCLRNTGVRCTFWGISHKALFKEKEDEKLNYKQFMEHDKCSFYKNKKTK